MSDEAFGDASGAEAEDIAGYLAVDQYAGAHLGQIGAYAQAGFAVGDFAANNLGLDQQALFAPLGGAAGEAAGQAVEYLADGVNALLAAYSDAGSSLSSVLEQIGEAVSEVSGGGCFLGNTDVLLGDRKTEEPIDDLIVGQRVATDGGVANSATGTTSSDPDSTAVNRKTWRLVTLLLDEGMLDGQENLVEIQALEPIFELKHDHAKVGAYISVPINLADMGLPDALAEVISIGACPVIASGPGRVVLATVTHLNNFLFRLTLTNLSGASEDIGVTGYHKIYTEDRGWVNASELVLGEKVRGADGDLTVTGLIRDPGVYHIYNISVESDHVYYVGDLQALVHNTWCDAVHHIIPKFLGGAEDTDYTAFLTGEIHQAVHRAIDEALREEFPGCPLTRYTDSWNTFFKSLPDPDGAREIAVRVLWRVVDGYASGN